MSQLLFDAAKKGSPLLQKSASEFISDSIHVASVMQGILKKTLRPANDLSAAPGDAGMLATAVIPSCLVERL